jgi:3-phenylpropionate/cinnamic acid dioxygenase small subunit
MRLLLQLEVDQLNAAYAAALDEKRFDDWPEFFLEDGRYTVQARENFDRGLPLALMALESRGMMKDRVYGVTQTIYHGPYYTRHVVGPPRRQRRFQFVHWSGWCCNRPSQSMPPPLPRSSISYSCCSPFC